MRVYHFKVNNMSWDLKILSPKYFIILDDYVLVDPEAIADGLNPLTINHTAITISCTAIGAINKIAITGEMFVYVDRIMPIKIVIAAINPQTDIKRGRSFDLYNAE